jgi:phosphatidylglycerophosphate synthase
MVHICANLGLSPNSVTSLGLALVLAACWAFLNGHYAAGLVAGWCMTFLDTVDGKLARVTIQSSRFGHYYDHVIDLVHPPFWYLFWGMSLEGPLAESTFDFTALGWTLVAAYLLGRVVEGLFPLLGSCGIFTWRPFDAWFRLITARRNPCLILLTLSVMIGRPVWGFIAVVGWSALSTGVLVVRLLVAGVSRLVNGPLQSWLSEADVASGPHAASFRVFGGTRGAFGA